MDAQARLNENFLSCNVCTDIFKDPCTLGCYHTFCRVCLSKYNRTRRDAISAKSIQCPNCLQMTKVPRPQEPVDQWSQQFKPSFLIQGLLDSFASQESSDAVGDCCFTCQQIGRTTHAISLCEDCDIKFCEACAKMHVAAPNGRDHVISPLGARSTPQPKKRKVMCQEHSCLVEFCCRDCRKAVCNKCCIVYHRKCNSVVTLDSMIPEMKQKLQQDYDHITTQIQQAGNTLKSKRSEVEEITQHKSSLQSEIRRVSQQAVDLIRRKEKKLETLTEKQTGELRSQIKSGKIDLQTYQQYTEFIKQVLQSNSPIDLYDMYMLCQSGEITAEIQKHDKPGETRKSVEFEKQFDLDQVDSNLQLGHLKVLEDKSNHPYMPKLLSTVGAKSKDDKCRPSMIDIEVLNIDGTETLVVIDFWNSCVKSIYKKRGKPYCRSIQFDQPPCTLNKISQDRVAVSYESNDSIEVIKLTPDPVLNSTIKTKKRYRCLTALSDTTLAAGCDDPPSIDVLNLSGRVLRSVITPNTGRQLIQSTRRVLRSVITPSTSQQLIQDPLYMCTTRQGHIIVSDLRSRSVYCVTQQGEILYKYQLTGGRWTGCGGVTTTDTGSVIVADKEDNKIVQLTETGQYVRDLLTGQDGIDRPRGMRVHGNKLYVTQEDSKPVSIFQL